MMAPQEFWRSLQLPAPALRIKEELPDTALLFLGQFLIVCGEDAKAASLGLARPHARSFNLHLQRFRVERQRD